MRSKKFIMTLLAVNLLIIPSIYSQAILEADGPGDTYELINSVLAPGYNCVEAPDESHPDFGRHITEVWDSTLSEYVFEFHLHVTPDNDKGVDSDRQRNEIKTFDSSPDSLIGVLGEKITYKWKFRLPEGFQVSPNFTHIHQIKPVNGDDSTPIFSIIGRAGSPDRLELKHDNINVLETIPLDSLRGVWVECTEHIEVGLEGAYSMIIKRISDGKEFLSYSSEKIKTIRANNSFIRPKWGIYRSLLNTFYLRDEIVRFNSFYIKEEKPTPPDTTGVLSALPVFDTRIDLIWKNFSADEDSYRIERSNDSVNWEFLAATSTDDTTYSDEGTDATNKYYYRVQSENSSGTSPYSNTVFIQYGKLVSIANGDWNSAFSWSGNSIPTSQSNILISVGNTINLSNDIAEANDVDVNGNLEFAKDGNVSSIVIYGNIMVNSGAKFRCTGRSPAGTSNSFVNHSLVLYGNLTVDSGGTFDMRGGSNSGGTSNGAELTFAGSTNSVIKLSNSKFSTSSEEFNSINIDKSEGAKVILEEGNLFMSNNSSTGPTVLNFINGMIETGSNIWSQTRTSSSGIVGASENSFILGSLGRGMNTKSGTIRDFEIGTETGYRPITIRSTTGLASRSIIVAKLIEGDANTGSSNLSDDIQNISRERYYELKAYESSDMSSATVSIDSLSASYLDNDGVEPGNTDLRVAYSNDDRKNWIGINQSIEHVTQPSSTPTFISPDTLEYPLTLDGTMTTINVALANINGGDNPLPVEEIEGNIPDSFHLAQNYPNPFNPTTSIKFSIPELSNVKMEIYNLLGEHIITLTDKEFSTGTYETSWNAYNEPSGIYLVKFNGQSVVSDKYFSETKKAILLK